MVRPHDGLVAFYATVGTLTPLFFLALFSEVREGREDRYNAFGALVAVVALCASEVVSLASLVSGNSSDWRIGLGVGAVYVGAGFVGFPLVDRAVERLITLGSSPSELRHVQPHLTRLRLVMRVVFVLSVPSVVFWTIHLG